ncbi:MAG: protein kinase, partial [Proteobacteria bacterium]|nr:protein kinase [Pseudomonadota bacterium]
MDNNSSIYQWRQANDLFETYFDIPLEESLALIENDENIPNEVKALVIRLLKSISTESTVIGQADLSYFDTLNHQHHDLSGTNIGDYHLICQIGQGGMAHVYKAKRINTDIQKFVALKILNKKQHIDKSLQSLFEKEQQTLSQLSHPNIISFHHGGLSTEEEPYLVMEYIEKSQSISSFCLLNKLNVKAIIELILPIIDAIAYAHQQLIIHKDLKPSNILIDQLGKPRLVDFGISAISDSKSKGDNPHIYTPDYASPEQFLRKKLTTSSDIFSFVATFLELLTGKKRAVPTNVKQYDYFNDKKNIAEILSTSELDSDLKNIIQKGLAEKPNQRYQSITELKQDLVSWLKSEPISATPQTSFYLFRKFVARNTFSSVLVSILLVVIIFSLTAMFRQMNYADREAKKAKQIGDFLIESIQASDPDITKGQDISVKELLNNAKIKIQEASLDDPLLTSSLQQNIGAALAKIGQYKQAMELLIKAISTDKNNYDARLSLCQLYLQHNQYDQSFKHYNYLKKHHSQLTTRQNIQLQQVDAAQLLLKGNFDQAIDVISALINTPDISIKQNIESHLILADILDKKGESQEAVKVLEKTLTISNQSIGNLSTTSTNISNRLADTLSSINPVPYEKLLAIYQQTIKTQIKIYGEKHPLVAKTYLQYGFALKATGNNKLAKELAIKARVIALDNFSEKHILTAHIDLLLSQIYLVENQIEEAITTLNHVVAIYANTYGNNHFETNQVKTTLALYLIKDTQGKQAIKILLPLYESQKKQLGDNHRATLYVALNLNKAY